MDPNEVIKGRTFHEWAVEMWMRDCSRQCLEGWIEQKLTEDQWAYVEKVWVDETEKMRKHFEDQENQP